jgi:hypothetical protein
MNFSVEKIKKNLIYIFPLAIFLVLFGKYFFEDAYLFGFAEWYSPYSVDHAWDYFFQSLFLYSDNNWGVPQYYPGINIFNGIRWILFLIFGMNIGQKIIIMSLFYFSFLSCFLFLKKISRESKFSYILALIFSFNPFILNHLVFGHIIIVISMFQLLFSAYFLIKFYENKKKSDLIWTILFFAINPIHPLYIPFYLFFYFLIGVYQKIFFWNNIRYLFVISIVFVLLNASWTLNLSLGSKSVDDVLNYKTSNMDRITRQSKPILNSFLNSEYSNKNKFLNDNENAQFFFDSSSILIWILMFVLIFNQKINNNVKFYAVTIGIIIFLMDLLAGPFSPFGKEAFEILYNLKIYQLYREVYHFVFLLIPMLFFLIAFIYSNLKKPGVIKGFAILILLVSLFLRMVGVSEYGKSSTFSNKIYYWDKDNLKENDEDYRFICDKYKTGQYILFLPFYHTIYDIRTGSQDKEGGADLFLARNCSSVIGNWITLTYPFEKMLNIFDKSNYSTSIFEQMGIEYVIFRKNFISGNERIYSTELVKNRISNDQNFSLVEENDNFVIYRNNYNDGLLNSYNLSFKKINSTKYKLYIKNLKNSQALSFYEIFSSNWELFLEPNASNNWCESRTFYKENNLTECQYKEKYFEGDELSYLYKKPIFKDTHKIINEYANQWTIDLDYIKKNYPKEYYIENPDGSIDIEMALYFKPQSYFYLGLLISGFTICGIAGYLIYDSQKRKRLTKEGRASTQNLK